MSDLVSSILFVGFMEFKCQLGEKLSDRFIQISALEYTSYRGNFLRTWLENGRDQNFVCFSQVPALEHVHLKQDLLYFEDYHRKHFSSFRILDMCLYTF